MIVGAGTFGASLAWWLAREGARRHARRPVRARRPPRDLGRRDAADPLRPRRRPRLHGLRTPRPHAVARARGRVGRGPADRVRARVVRPPRRRLGGRVGADHARAGHPRRAAGAEEGARLFPSFRGDDLEFLLHEPEAGVLRAQRATQTLAAAGRRARRAPRARAGAARRRRVVWTAASALEADAVVWACGGWLAELFPGLVVLTHHAPGPVLPRRRRAVDARARLGRLRRRGLRHRRPRRARRQGRARLRGPAARARRRAPGRQPSQRALDPRLLRRAASRRSPRRRCKGSTSCRYELSPDSHFLAAPHPEHPGVWLLGGGSGHGFKHGPAMAERMAAALRGGEPCPRARARRARDPGSRCAPRVPRR